MLFDLKSMNLEKLGWSKITSINLISPNMICYHVPVLGIQSIHIQINTTNIDHWLGDIITNINIFLKWHYSTVILSAWRTFKYFWWISVLTTKVLTIYQD